MQKSKGNMYGFITHTCNPIKWNCIHDCEYCYMKKWWSLGDVRLVEKEFKYLWEWNFIFIGSWTDMWVDNIPDEWIQKVIDHTLKYPKNKYLLQTKNPKRFLKFNKWLGDNYIFCTTIESPDAPSYNAQSVYDRWLILTSLWKSWYKTMVTVEPVMKFNPQEFSDMLNTIKPNMIAIWADSQKCWLNEPTKQDIDKLRQLLDTSIYMYLKDNLYRIK